MLFRYAILRSQLLRCSMLMSRCSSSSSHVATPNTTGNKSSTKNAPASSSLSSSQLGAIFNRRPSAAAASTPSTRAKSATGGGSFNTLMSFLSAKSSSLAASSSSSSTAGNCLFSKRELSNVNGFAELKDKAEARVHQLLAEALVDDDGDDTGLCVKRGRKLVEILDDISNELCCVADLTEFVRTSHPDVAYRLAANDVFNQISQIVEKLNTNYELYARLKSSLAATETSADRPQLDECDRRVGHLLLNDFEQSGIHLDKRARDQYVDLTGQLIETLMQFQINSQAPAQIRVSQVNAKYHSVVKYYNDPISVETMFVNSDDPLLREFIYKTYLQANAVQEAYFRQIIKKRKQIANVSGFASFSHRANQFTMLETPAKIVEFLDECSQATREQADGDFAAMRAFKRDVLGSTQPLMQWDVPGIVEKMKRSRFSLDRSDYMNYLSLGSCMEGLNMIVGHLYNVTLETVRQEPGEMLWHGDIYKLAVRDNADKSLLGYIYCDFFSRANKFSHVDCHFTIQCSKQMSAETYQLPIVVLHLNFAPPSVDRPTLLSFEMMENLFHEFGHAMHSMFAKTRYQHVSGTRCSTDLAEVPSQLMEFYCRDPRVLKLFAKHYATQEPMDDATIHKLCQSKKLFASCDIQSQIVNSMLDQAFHTIESESALDDPAHMPVRIVEKYVNEYHTLPYVPDTHWHLRYTHLVGYGAKYYSYLVSKAIASKIWSECFERDPLSASAGHRYRTQLLQYGGERSAKELVASVVGGDMNTKSLVKSLLAY